MLILPYIDAPNPYYQALKMKLYYEFMIVENLSKIASWRDFKKAKQSSILKEHFAARRKHFLLLKLNFVETVMICLEISSWPSTLTIPIWKGISMAKSQRI